MLPEYFAYLTILIALYACVAYVKDELAGKTKPNRVSWIFWGIAPLVATYIGYKSGVSLPFLAATFMSGFICIPVVIASFFNKNAYWKTTASDMLCGLLSLVAIVIWVTTKNGVISIAFAILADLFAGIPTMIKSWEHADTENTAPYTLGIVNQIITFFMIKNISFLNFAFPLYLILANSVILCGIENGRMKHLRLKRSTEN
jgi:hypothetical protein